MKPFNESIHAGAWPLGSLPAYANLASLESPSETRVGARIRAVLLASICLVTVLTPLTFWPTKSWIPSFPFYEIGLGIVFSLFILSVAIPRLALPKLSKVDALLFCFVTWVVINALTKGSWAEASPFIDMALLLFVILHTELTRTQSKVLLISLLATGFIVAMIGIWEYVFLNVLPAKATLRAENTFSGYLSLLLPMSLFLWVSRNSYVRGSGLILTTALAFGMSISSTRAGYIAAIFGMLIFALIKDRRLVVLPFIYMLVFGFVVDEARNRFCKIGALAAVAQKQEPKDASLAIRLHLWKFAWNKFKSSPLTGIGVGNFFPELEKYRQQNPQDRDLCVTLEPHNTVLKVLCELGLPGAVLFLSLIGAAMWNPMKWLITAKWSTTDPWGVAVLSGMLAFLVHNLTNTLFILIPCVLGFWICLGVLPALIRPEKRPKASPSAQNLVNGTSYATSTSSN